MTKRPTSVFLYGPSRAAVSLALYGFAQATNPKFLWVDIRIVGEPDSGGDPTNLGWVSGDRLVAINRLESLRPNDAASTLDVSKVLSEDESEAAKSGLVSFLQLPETTQEMLTVAPTGPRPGLVAVSNAQRMMGVYAGAHIAPILQAHANAGYSLFVGYAETPGPGRGLFDYVLRLDCETLRDWAQARIVCEKGAGPGPFTTGAAHSLLDLPFLAQTFRRALESA